jgi:hypothetical protein
VLDRNVQGRLAIVDRIRQLHERSGRAVDAELRAAFLRPPPFRALDPGQRQLAERCGRLEGRVLGGVELDEVRSPTPLVLMSAKIMPALDKKTKEVLGRATATIDCPPLEGLAWWSAQCCREHMRRSREQGDPARFILDIDSAQTHDFSFVAVKRAPQPFYNREFVGRQLCYEEEETGELVIAFEPLPRDFKVDYGGSVGAVRAEVRGTVRFKAEGDAQTRLTLTLTSDVGGHVPLWLIKSKIDAALGGAADMREFFQRDEEIDAMERSSVAEVVR